MFPTKEKCHYGPRHSKDCFSRPLNESKLGSYRVFCPQHALSTARFMGLAFPGMALVTASFYLAFLFGLIANENMTQGTALLLLAVLYGALTLGYFHDKVLRRRLNDHLKARGETRELLLESDEAIVKDSVGHFIGALLRNL